MPGTVSAMDVEHLAAIRANVTAFLADAARRFESGPATLLDIAPQIHAGARPHFSDRVRVDTLDLDPKAGATYSADLCRCNENLIPAGAYDFVVCTEVLEHTLQPFDAVREMHRILKPGGLLLLTVPFNFRIHGPLPDCWRFTEHGLRAILSEFDILELHEIETPGRFLMPIHYTAIARKRGHASRPS